uniref:Uncharacterized protein n=1 Tax=Rhizophora mucronata TaxID=61149 RepID=A0A2P2PA90_RHIMU
MLSIFLILFSSRLLNARKEEKPCRPYCKILLLPRQKSCLLMSYCHFPQALHES